MTTGIFDLTSSTAAVKVPFTYNKSGSVGVPRKPAMRWKNMRALNLPSHVLSITLLIVLPAAAQDPPPESPAAAEPATDEPAQSAEKSNFVFCVPTNDSFVVNTDANV